MCGHSIAWSERWLAKPSTRVQIPLPAFRFSEVRKQRFRVLGHSEASGGDPSNRVACHAPSSARDQQVRRS